MAHLKDLLVNGAARVLGKLYASEFVGNLTGNATTASKLGTATVGSHTTPIYLNAGVPTATSYRVGATSQIAVIDSDYTNYRPLIFGFSNSGSAGFTPTTVTDVVYSCKSLYVRPASGLIHGTKVEGAVFNDLADAIPVGEGDVLEAGYCYGFDGEHYTKTSKYMQKSYIGIHSDTYGFLMGHEEGKEKLNVAVAGFALAYVDREYEVGTPLTCTTEGYLTEIKLEDKVKYPERIVATFWKNEPNEEWGPEGNEVKVNGRKWVKVK